MRIAYGLLHQYYIWLTVSLWAFASKIKVHERLQYFFYGDACLNCQTWMITSNHHIGASECETIEYLRTASWTRKSTILKPTKLHDPHRIACKNSSMERDRVNNRNDFPCQLRTDTHPPSRSEWWEKLMRRQIEIRNASKLARRLRSCIHYGAK